MPAENVDVEWGGFIKWAAVGLVFFVLVLNTIVIVGAGERAVILTLGKPEAAPLGEGFHTKIPFIQQAVKIDVKTYKYPVYAAAASKDLQIVSSEITLNYHPNPDSVPDLYKQVGLNFETKVIAPMVQETVKAVTAKYTAEELITRRPQVKEDIKTMLYNSLLGRGIVVEDVSITNFDFSDSFNAAIEAKVTAEQLKLKAERDLERIRVEAEQTEAEAVGRKKAAIAEAEGSAQATLLKATAEAEAIRLVNSELGRSTQYVDYLTVKTWDGQLPQVTGGVVPFLQINTTG